MSIPAALWHAIIGTSRCKQKVSDEGGFVSRPDNHGGCYTAIQKSRAGSPPSLYTGAMSNLDHVLVVDDDAEIRGLLRAYLEKNGYRVTAVGDGKAMWAAFDDA